MVDKTLVEFDVAKAVSYFHDLDVNQVPFAAAQTLNRVAFQIAVGEGGRGLLRREIDKHLIGGAEKFTKQGFQYMKASKRKLIAHVIGERHGDRVSPGGVHIGGGGAAKRRYLTNILKGGTVQPPDKPRRVNLITPTRYTPKSAINKHGNVKKGAYAALRADTKKYFYGFPQGKPKSDKFLGLYERPGVRRLSGSNAASVGTTHTPRKKKGRLKMIFHTGYKSRPIGRLFPATEIAKAYARRRLPFEFSIQIRKAMRTAR